MRVVKVRLGADVSDYEKGMLAAARATRTVGTEAEKLEQKKQAFDQVGRGLVLTGTALTAVTALSVKAAMDWESAWAGVTKTVDGNATQMSELEEGLRSLAQTLPATHQQIAAVAEAAGQLGVARGDVVDFTRTMIDLSETTNLSADEAATSIAQLMNVMRTAPEEVDNLGSALVALGNDGASTERDILQMAQRIAGAGRTVGLTESQVLGFANALASVGIEAEAGGSAISRIMTDIAMSVSSGGENLDEFATVAGLSSAEFQKAFKEAPADAIATFVEGLGRIDATGGDVFKTLSDLGQSDIRVSQALLGMANSGNLLRESLELGSEAWGENTALAVEAAKRYETTEAKLKIAGNAVRDAAIDFGDVFLPAVSGASDAVAEFAAFMGGLPDPVQGIIGVLTMAVGIIALTGGAALVAIPKWVAFRVAVDELGWSMKSIGLIGGGAILALTALVTVVGSVASAQAAAQQKAESYADTLAEGTNKITSATRDMVKDNLAQVDGWAWVWNKFGESTLDAAEQLGLGLDTVVDAASGSAEAMKELQDQTNNFQKAGPEAAKIYRELGITGTEYQKAVEKVESAVKGEASSVAEAIRIAEQKQSADSDSAESSQTAAEAYLAQGEAVDDLNSQLTQLIDSINKANGVGQDAVATNASYQAALAGISEEVQRQKDAYEETNGTLDGFTLSLDESTVAGSANAAMLGDVAGRAQEAAAAQYEQDRATMSSKDAADKYYGTLQSQRQAFIDSALAAGYNADQVQILADKVFSLDGTEAAVKILADTAPATWSIDNLINSYNGRVIRLKAAIDRGAANQELAGIVGVGMVPHAAGAVYGPGGVKEFAGGGFEPGIYPYTPGGIHKFAEEYGEAYISMDPRRRERSERVWVQAGQRMGFMGSQQASAPQLSLDGLSITGTFEIGGDGLGRIIDGRIQQRGDAVSRGVRNGRWSDA